MKREVIVFVLINLLLVIIVYAANNVPAIGSVTLNSTAPANNNTLQNLTCWNISVTDADGESVKTIFNWYKDEVMLEFLNFPFEGNTTKGKDYSNYNSYCSEGGVIHFETFDGGITDISGYPWTARDGNWLTTVVEPNIKKFGAYSGNTTDTDGGNGSIYLIEEYNPKDPDNAIDNTSEVYLDLWYKCELGARWGIMVSNDSWNCIKGSGNTSCGDNYHHIGNLTPSVVCDDTWRNTGFNLSKEFPGKAIKEVILGDWDRINTSNQDKVMWFDNFQIYNISRVPVWNSTGGYDGFGAYEFDGLGDFIHCGRDRFPNYINLSISLWVKTASSNAFIAGAYTNYPTKLGYGLSLTSGNITFSGDLQDIYSIQVNDSKWHHIVGTSRTNPASPATSLAKIYVDGIERKTDSVAGPEPWSIVTIGSYHGALGYTSFLNGTVDDVRIYNHTLSAEQVALLYENKSWMIHSEETKKGEDWKCSVTPVDGTEAGSEVNSSTVTILNSDPEVSLRSPANNSQSTLTSIEFIYNVTDNDGNEIENCTLWIENSTGLVVGGTDTSITIDQNQSFSTTLPREEINWTISCEDSSSSEANSTKWNYTVFEVEETGPTGGASKSSSSSPTSPEEETIEEEKEKEIEIKKQEKQDQTTSKSKEILSKKESKIKIYTPIILVSLLIVLFIIFNWKTIIKVLKK